MFLVDKRSICHCHAYVGGIFFKWGYVQLLILKEYFSLRYQ